MTVSERGAECLEAGDVAGQLEDAENAEDPKDLGRLGDVLQAVLGGEGGQDKRDVKRKDAEQVNYVEEGGKECKLAGGDNEPV